MIQYSKFISIHLSVLHHPQPTFASNAQPFRWVRHILQVVEVQVCEAQVLGAPPHLLKPQRAPGPESRRWPVDQIPPSSFFASGKRLNIGRSPVFLMNTSLLRLGHVEKLLPKGSPWNPMESYHGILQDNFLVGQWKFSSEKRGISPAKKDGDSKW